MTAEPYYRHLRGRMVYLDADGFDLASHLRRTADAVEAVERDECVKNDNITEGVSQVVVDYHHGEGWSSLLVIE